MPLTPSRPVATFDLMAFVAAVAAGFAIIRSIWPRDTWQVMDPNMSFVRGMRPWLLAQYTLSAVLSFLVPWTPALVLLRVRQPRPCLRRLLRQPGTSACVAASLAMAIELVWILPLLAVGSRAIQLATLSSWLRPRSELRSVRLLVGACTTRELASGADLDRQGGTYHRHNLAVDYTGDMDQRLPPLGTPRYAGATRRGRSRRSKAD